MACCCVVGRFAGAMILAIGFAAQAASADRWAAPVEAVSAENIRRHTVVLGGDALEGRAPGSRGGQLAAAYLASELERLGAEPLGDDGTFFQQVPLVGSSPLPESRLTISGLGEHKVIVTRLRGSANMWMR